MRYDFLVETYATERVKVLGVWSEIHDDDLTFRPNRDDPRGRSFLEHMVHQCVSENLWFLSMLKIDIAAQPLPEQETRTGFMRRYALDSGKRLAALTAKVESWFEVGYAVFYRSALDGLGAYPSNFSYLPPSWATDGHASHAGPRPSQ